MAKGLRDFLTPGQIEDLESGWYVAVVLGPSDLDVMHAALTLPYCDDASKRLSNKIEKQIEQIQSLDRMRRAINAVPDGEDG